MIGEHLANGRTATIHAWGNNHIVKLYRDGFENAAEWEFKLVQTVHAAGVHTPAAVEIVEVNGRSRPSLQTASGQQHLPWRLPSRQRDAHISWPHHH
ncbi:MAG: hypothetical protein GY943_26445 [Chloroflexi bacterium]|nr:hypothetical protein [Chloroflexota bacterium]